MTPSFMFATGIENSYSTIHNGRERGDEFEKCGHYKQWQTDFEKVQELCTRFLQYGPPIHRTFLGPDRFDYILSQIQAPFSSIRVKVTQSEWWC
jgi:beta-glucosidase